MVLRKGAEGDKVSELQERLKLLGLYKGRVDGDFGRGTRTAVIAFQQSYLVDGIVDGVTGLAIESAVKAWSQKPKHLIIPVPRELREVEAQFGEIEYIDTGGGVKLVDGVPVWSAIEITNGWADKNIIKANLPVVGEQLMHVKMKPVFEAVMQNIKDRGLDKEIRMFGCWSPRHKMHNPARGLSMHSWGIACDVNWDTNGVGKVGDLDPSIVDSFERFGFQWGGRWGYRDDMHLEYTGN